MLLVVKTNNINTQTTKTETAKTNADAAKATSIEMTALLHQEEKELDLILTKLANYVEVEADDDAAWMAHTPPPLLLALRKAATLPVFCVRILHPLRLAGACLDGALHLAPPPHDADLRLQRVILGLVFALLKHLLSKLNRLIHKFFEIICIFMKYCEIMWIIFCRTNCQLPNKI